MPKRLFPRPRPIAPLGAPVRGGLDSLFARAMADLRQRESAAWDALALRLDAADPGREPLDGSGEWVTAAEAAQRLHVAPRTVYRLVADGTLEARKLGRLRVNLASVGRRGQEVG